MGVLQQYARWLHLRWPSGTVEKLPEVRPGGATNVRGIYVAGDLAGLPLLKCALDSGARAVETIAATLQSEMTIAVPAPAIDPGPSGSPEARRESDERPLDLVIVGGGVSGVAAAAEAQRRGLRFEIIEASSPLTTLVNFPKAKPIFTYPHAMRPAGPVQVSADVKEALVAELESQMADLGIEPRPGRVVGIARAAGRLQVRLEDGTVIVARSVLIAIGRSGDFRRLGVPGESLDKVFNRLHDPKDFTSREVLVVGGGDSALEAAVALAECGASVTLVHRGSELTRPKHANLERLRRMETGSAPHARGGRLSVRLGTCVTEIRPREVVLKDPQGQIESVPNDVVFSLIGRAAPLELLRRAGVRIVGEHSTAGRAALVLFLLGCAWLYDWKSGGWFARLWSERHWFPANLPALLAAAGGSIAAAARDPRTLLGTLAISASGPSFYYTLAYSLVVVIFGVRRIRRRKTAYVTAQTLTLIAIQVVPLFLLPEIILPQLDVHGWLPRGLADALFPAVSYGHGREFWRAYGLILAWPLDVYNLFTHRPLWWWIGIGFTQTFVLIPLGVYYFGKGAYCGWVCSCGALAETLGDTQRHKMPHGPLWSRLDLAGQAVLLVAAALMVVRVLGWALPEGNAPARLFESVLQPGYKWTVDVFLAGVLGYGLYFWYSGRFWCRFFCPLAALMHIYARFSRFAIIAEKKKCISCNACTASCHQGIDVMNFANRGAPMRDPECVRCSACVAACPTGVLQFGQVTRSGRIISVDRLTASRVRLREGP
jgi:thioredoxin reductase/ferredoxin